MKLNGQSYEAITHSTKRVESRLFDEKRKNIRVDDIIEFTTNDPLPSRSIVVRVVEVMCFPTFASLVKFYPRIDLGFSEETSEEQILSQIYKIYSQVQGLQFGVVGIRFEL